MKTLECIMLIDDDHLTNFYNKIILEKGNAANEIVVFENGKTALEYLKDNDNKVDLILLDINMPLMNGWQFLEHYDKLDDKRKAKMIIMLTSSAHCDDKKMVEKHGSVKKFINKPLVPDTIKLILSLFE